MKNSRLYLLFSIVMLIGACTSEKKQIKSSDCSDCPPPVSIEIPDELSGNEEATIYIQDAEAMFNKWSKKAYILAKEIEEDKADSVNKSVNEGLRKGTNAFKIMAFVGEFMQDGLAMSDRMEELKVTMTEEEKQAFDKVWEQLEDQLEEIENTFQDLGVDISLDNEELVIGSEDEE